MAYQVSKETTKMIYYGIFILFVAVVILFGAKFYFKQDINTEQLENNLLISRILFSEDCLGGEEFNLDNFNEEQIRKCTGIQNQGLKLTISDFYNSSIILNEIEINPEIISQCLLLNVKNIRDQYDCNYLRYYVLEGNETKLLEILVANENK